MSKTTNELQAELRALVQRVKAEGYLSTPNAERYESILKRLYLIGVKPAVTIEQCRTRTYK